MGVLIDRVPSSGIIRIRDLMYTVRDPFRLDQGDVSFDAPESVKSAMTRAIADNRSHYLPTAGVPRLRELLAEKLRTRNRIPVSDPDEVFVTGGGIHAIYLVCQALLDPGDEVIVPDPLWPPAVSNVIAAQAVPVPCRLHESLGWRFDLDELSAAVTPRTRMLYLNSPGNPAGGVLAAEDLAQIADVASRHDLWILSDEAYEDVVFDGRRHESIASLPGLYERTLPVCTFSKSWAMTGLRVGYVAVADRALRERVRKLLFLTSTNVSSVAQFGAMGALEGPQDSIEAFRRELEARRDLFYAGLERASGGRLRGAPPHGAFYAFVRMEGDWTPFFRSRSVKGASVGADRDSWAAVEFLIERGRIGCVPGVDFGTQGEGHIRFCFARERQELTAALEAMERVFRELAP